MKVKELIDKLLEMPMDSKVWHIWDGDPRTEISVVYLAKNGDVMTADYNQYTCTKEAMPEDYIGDRYNGEEDPNDL